MKIDEAIEILSKFGHYGADMKFKDIQAAVNLGIEALKFIKKDRKIYGIPTGGRLIGETEE